MLGGDSNGVAFKDFCWTQWKDRYGTSPPWGKKEFSQLHEARQRLDTEDLARSTWNTFLNSNDPYHEGHSPGQFLYSLSKMTARAVKNIPRQRRDAMTEDPQWAERTAALIRLHREVNEDATIPEPMKRDEVSKRFRTEFPE